MMGKLSTLAGIIVFAGLGGWMRGCFIGRWPFDFFSSDAGNNIPVPGGIRRFACIPVRLFYTLEAEPSQYWFFCEMLCQKKFSWLSKRLAQKVGSLAACLRMTAGRNMAFLLLEYSLLLSPTSVGEPVQFKMTEDELHGMQKVWQACDSLVNRTGGQRAPTFLNTFTSKNNLSVGALGDADFDSHA